MTQGRENLVKGRVNARPADMLNAGFRLTSFRQALADLLKGVDIEQMEQVVHGILAHGPDLMAMLMMARLRPMVVMAPPR
jgi:hypothetical protein